MMGSVPAPWSTVTAAFLLVAASATPAAVLAQDPPATDDCPVTQPQHWPAPVPWAAETFETRGWYGSEQLAALLPADGIWRGMGPEANYGDKFWWWRAGYDAREEPRPDLVLSAVRLDGPAPPVTTDRATSGYGKGWDAMLVGMEFPTAGCWEVRGNYNGAQKLIVVLLVMDT